MQKQVTYYYNGQKASDFNFKNGQSEGFHNMYFANGQKYIEEFFKYGQIENYQRRWYNNGQLAREVLHKNGRIIHEHLFDKTGKRTN